MGSCSRQANDWSKLQYNTMVARVLPTGRVSKIEVNQRRMKRTTNTNLPPQEVSNTMNGKTSVKRRRDFRTGKSPNKKVDLGGLSRFSFIGRRTLIVIAAAKDRYQGKCGGRIRMVNATFCPTMWQVRLPCSHGKWARSWLFTMI